MLWKREEWNNHFSFYILTFILEYTMIITQYGKNVDGDSTDLTKAKASQGEWKPGASSGFWNITPKLQAEQRRNPWFIFE